MNWNGARPSFENLTREGRRIRACCSENSLSVEETEAFSLAVFEIGQAIASAQPHPIGDEKSLSAECVALFLQAAKMAERERREACLAGTFLVPIRGDGEVVPFPAPDGQPV
jgi:hypothetical protein